MDVRGIAKDFAERCVRASLARKFFSSAQQKTALGSERGFVAG
jgi:hypothetical protein